MLDSQKNQRFYSKIMATFRRFPIAILFCSLTGYLLFYMVDKTNRVFLIPQRLVPHIGQLLSILIGGILYFTAYSLFLETYKRKKSPVLLILSVLPFLLISSYLYSCPVGNQLVVTTTLVSSALVLILFTLQGSLSYYPPLSGFVSIATYSLLFSIIWSLKSLFNLTLYDNIYKDIFVLIFAFLFPLLTLAATPLPSKKSEIPLSNFINLSLTYFTIPSLLFYIVILWIYLVKILVTWKLPINRIITLTLISNSLGAATYLISSSLPKTSVLIEWFSRNFFKLLPPTLLAATFSLLLRVQEYGLTPVRYLGLLVLTGLLITTVYSFVRAKNKLSNFLLLTMSVLLLIASASPCGMISVSNRSQRQKLAQLLEKHQLLIAGKIKPSPNPLPVQIQKQIQSKLEYLIAFDSRLEIKAWFPPEIQKKLDQGSSYQKKKIMMQTLAPTKVTNTRVSQFDKK